MDERSEERDWRIRSAAFIAAERMIARHGPTVPWSAIVQGFEFEGRRIRFATQAKGIFKPEEMIGVLSILSSKADARKGRKQSYEDSLTLYHFRRGQRGDSDNRLLQRAMEIGAPLIYFFGVAPGQYKPIWPVRVLGTRQVASGEVACDLSLDDEDSLTRGPTVADPIATEVVRRYAAVIALKRLHQDKFRMRVLHAYDRRCAVCGLSQPALLEAAHILPDKHEGGEPVVRNGLALCRLHHGAFDADLMGIDPNGIIELSPKLLAMRDGPMLQYALQAFHGQPIKRPKRKQDQPDPGALETRYKQFQKAGETVRFERSAQRARRRRRA